MKQEELKNEQIKAYSFLQYMYEDPYFPNFVVDKGKQLLIDLCEEIEKQAPKSLEDLYKLSHKTTDQFNDLQDDFWNNESDIETGARECIMENIEFIAKTYGFEADDDELVATRDW